MKLDRRPRQRLGLAPPRSAAPSCSTFSSSPTSSAPTGSAPTTGTGTRRAAPRPHAPDFERAERIGEFWSYPESRPFAELLIDCEEDRTLRAVLVGMLRDTNA
jgi:hypothetical protein